MQEFRLGFDFSSRITHEARPEPENDPLRTNSAKVGQPAQCLGLDQLLTLALQGAA